MNKKTIFFIAAVLSQVLILAAVPAQKIFTINTGTAILLKTSPYDPYSIMSGYYVNLNYEISNPKLPEWKTWPRSQQVWVVLTHQQNNLWDAVAIYKTRPDNVPDGCLVIKGKIDYFRIVYGIEAYFIPESVRTKVESDLRTYRDEAKVEVKIDSFGNAALRKLIIRDQIYEY